MTMSVMATLITMLTMLIMLTMLTMLSMLTSGLIFMCRIFSFHIAGNKAPLKEGGEKKTLMM